MTFTYKRVLLVGIVSVLILFTFVLLGTLFLFKSSSTQGLFIDLGECTKWGNRIPYSFPSDIPIYQPSRPFAGFVVCESGKKINIAALVSSGEKKNVNDYYKRVMSDLGWVIVAQSQYSFAEIMFFERGLEELEVRTQQSAPLGILYGKKGSFMIWLVHSTPIK